MFLSLKALGIGNNDDVITVPNTAIPTVSAIRQAGARPVFVDVNQYGLMDHDKLREVINKNTKAIIPVHLYGFPCNIKAICEIGKESKIPIIEDCSQAHGSTFKNKSWILWRLICIFFLSNKILGGYGDAGMICTKMKL